MKCWSKVPVWKSFTETSQLCFSSENTSNLHNLDGFQITFWVSEDTIKPKVQIELSNHQTSVSAASCLWGEKWIESTCLTLRPMFWASLLPTHANFMKSRAGTRIKYRYVKGICMTVNTHGNKWPCSIQQHFLQYSLHSSQMKTTFNFSILVAAVSHVQPSCLPAFLLVLHSLTWLCNTPHSMADNKTRTKDQKWLYFWPGMYSGVCMISDILSGGAAWASWFLTAAFAQTAVNKNMEHSYFICEQRQWSAVQHVSIYFSCNLTAMLAPAC